MYEIEVTVRGLTPILMHSARAMMAQASVRTRSQSIPLSEDEAELSAYKTEDGFLYMPGDAFRSSIVQAAGPYKQGRTSVKSVLSGAILEMKPEELILVRDGKRITEYAVDVRRVVVQGNAVLRSRARIDLPWETTWEMWIDENMFNESFIKDTLPDIINRAGLVIGVGDFRPGSPKCKTGRFGRYEIAKYEFPVKKGGK